MTNHTSQDSAPARRTWLRRQFTVKRLVLGVIGVALLVGFGSMLAPDAVDVDIAVAGTAPLRVTVDVEARTRVRDRYVVAAPVTGLVERLLVREGDVVRADEVIARLAPAPLDGSSARQLEARLTAARSIARGAESRLHAADEAAGQAERDATRAAAMFEAGAISKRAAEEAQLAKGTRADDLLAARANAAAAAADVEQARAALMHGAGNAAIETVLRAPAAGRVLRLAGRSERVVAAGTMIAEIGDTRRLEVVADVLSSDAVRVRPGMPALLTGADDQPAIAGRVSRVEPSATTRVSALGVEEQRVAVLIDVAEPPVTLGDGYRLDARIVVWSGDSVLTVPSSALVRDGSGWTVYVVEAGRALRRPVKVGRIGGASAQILEGVVSGTEVVVFPSDRVRDGSRVTRANDP